MKIRPLSSDLHDAECARRWSMFDRRYSLERDRAGAEFAARVYGRR